MTVESKLKQTKNMFKFIGKVARIDKDGAYKDEVFNKKGHKYHGTQYRALRFGVKTSLDNEMTVEMFTFEPEEVFLWNSDLAKKAKEKGGKYKGERVPFSEWLKKEDKLKEKGYSVLQSRIGVEHDEKGELIKKGVPSFVASEEIYNNLVNGDSVVVEGSIRYSSYENQQGKTIEQKQYTIEKIHKLKKDVDFEDEKFEEISYFEQQFVFVDAEKDTEEEKVYVTGRIINYGGTWYDAQFIIDYSDGDKDIIKLAEAFYKKLSFGDLVDVFGDTLNKVVTAEVEDGDDDDDDLLASLGGKQKPSHANFTAKNYIKEMRILGISAIDQKHYEEDDFVVVGLVEEEDKKVNKIQDEFGGKKNNKKNNPFEEDDFGDELEDDELPF